jgi:hypothetical protein
MQVHQKVHWCTRHNGLVRRGMGNHIDLQLENDKADFVRCML